VKTEHILPAVTQGPVRMECLCNLNHHPQNLKEQEEHHPVTKEQNNIHNRDSGYTTQTNEMHNSLN